MNARQRKKALDGRSPRLVERLLGVARGTCSDVVTFDREKPRSYRGARFVPTSSPVTARHVEGKPICIDMAHASFQEAPVYLDCDGDGRQHLVEGWRDEDGVLHIKLDGKEIPQESLQLMRERGRLR